MLSHLGVRFYGLNIGVFAVVIFYILAGYVVTHLYLNIIPKESQIYNYKFSIKNYKLFVKNRVKRIFPLYLFILSITTIFILLTGYGKPDFTLFKIFNNITIIPLNFYMWIDSDILTEPKWCLIPPAWSLGTELQAYLLLPFTILFFKFRVFIILITFSIYLIANLNIIHPDYFGYRLIIGVFFIFLIGVSIQNIRLKKDDRFDKIFLITIWIATLFFILTIIYLNIPIKAYAKETSIGVLIGTPLVYFLSKYRKKFFLNKTLGSLSYAIFLSHFLAIWIVDWLKIDIFYISYKLEVIILTLFISILGIFFEKRYSFILKNVEKM
jgi:peptidoglycan/LPS O-acetylase OafA/YrhL